MVLKIIRNFLIEVRISGVLGSCKTNGKRPTSQCTWKGRAYSVYFQF